MDVGCRGKNLLFVTDHVGTSDSADIQFIKIPKELSHIPPKELIDDYELWNGEIVEKSAHKDPKKLKVAFITVYRLPCGIATYSEMLYPELTARIGDYRIFAEDLEDAAPEDKVVRCWKRGQPLDRLIAQVHSYNPDVVHIQHEYGMFPQARAFLSLIAQFQKYKTVVTLHSVYNHLDKLICEAAIQNIIVHTELAAQVLKDKGTSAKITVIPHGSIPCTNQDRYWNIYYSKHTLIQFGFGFRYKGWEDSITAVAILKEKYPDVFLTGIFSESKFSKKDHDSYYEELNDLIHRLDIVNNVALIRGYQTDAALNSYLRTSQVAIFPYISNGDHTVFACSGAARVAMKTGTPTIVSNVPLFADLEGVCPRVNNVNELCSEIEMLWTDKSAKTAQIDKQIKFLEKTSWANVADAHAQLFSRL